MNPTIGWVPGVPPADKTPFVLTERFLGTGNKWRIWLLADARCVAVHFKRDGESKTQPCLKHEGQCELCRNPQWLPRVEAYAPAMLEVPRMPDPHWAPLLAIFTAGGYKQLGAAPHRGKMFDIHREGQGRSTVMKLSQLQVSDPLRPAFEIDGLIKRMWWPDSYPGVVTELPERIPIPKEQIARTKYEPALQPVTLTPEEREKVGLLTRAYVEKLNAEAAAGVADQAAAQQQPAGPPAPHSPAVPAAAAASRGMSDAAPDEAMQVVLARNAKANGYPPSAYGPKKPAGVVMNGDGDEAALTQRAGHVVCQEQKAKAPHLNGHGRQKGGAS